MWFFTFLFLVQNRELMELLSWGIFDIKIFLKPLEYHTEKIPKFERFKKSSKIWKKNQEYFKKNSKFFSKIATNSKQKLKKNL